MKNNKKKIIAFVIISICALFLFLSFFSKSNEDTYFQQAQKVKAYIDTNIGEDSFSFIPQDVLESVENIELVVGTKNTFSIYFDRNMDMCTNELFFNVGDKSNLDDEKVYVKEYGDGWFLVDYEDYFIPSFCYIFMR